MSTLKKEIAILKYGLIGWMENDPLPDNRVRFSCYKESGWKGFLFAILFLIVFESVAIQIFLYDHHAWFAYLHLFLVFYGVVWLLGDYQAIKKNCITLKSEIVHVHIGLRWNFDIPFHNINAVELGTPKELDAPLEIKMNQFVTKRKLKGYEKITVAGKPNLTLKLKVPMTIAGPFGIYKTMDQIGLSIDEPNLFIKSLRIRTGMANNASAIHE